MEQPPRTDKVDQWLSENEIIDILIDCKSSSTGQPRLDHFLNGISTPFRYDQSYHYKGVHIARCVLREKMGFSKNSKPGDFDVILIPFNEGRMLFERTAVYEIKVVRPTRRSIKKSPNSIGVSQVKGLISDGFPFVMLMHVCMTEPLQEHEKMRSKFLTIALNSGEKLKPGTTPDDYAIDYNHDHFSQWSADNQMKRMISQDIPKYVGLTAFGLDIFPDSRTISTCSFDLAHFEYGYFNPHKSTEAIDRVQKHFEAFPEEYKEIILR